MDDSCHTYEGVMPHANESLLGVIALALGVIALATRTLQHTATYCSTLQHTATHCNTLQHTAVHCNTLQHTATHCNTVSRCFLRVIALVPV